MRLGVSVLAAVAAGVAFLVLFPAAPPHTNSDDRPEDTQKTPSASLPSILSNGSYYYVVLKEATIPDVAAIEAARSRGATVTLATGSCEVDGFDFYPIEYLSEEGVLVDGGYWVRIEP